MTATFKVRTGCKTCKIRKVKCDEVKPNCRRCTSTGRKCDGYEPIPPRKTPRRAGQSGHGAANAGTIALGDRSFTPGSSLDRSRGTSPASRDSSLAVSRRVTPYPSVSPEPAFLVDIPLEHQQWIHHFRDYLAPALSGRFENDVWSVLLPQLGRREPAILYAIACISAGHTRFMHQHRYQKRARLQAESYEISHYNRAIFELRSRHDPANESLVSVACSLLFTLFECLYGNRSNALIHLRHGLQILDTTEEVDWALDTRKILLRFSTQSVLFGNYTSETATFWDIVQPAMALQLPEAFTSPAEALSYLDILISAALSFVYKYRHTVKTAEHSTMVNGPHDALVGQVRRWKALMRPFLWQSDDSSSMSPDPQAYDLWIRCQAASVWIQSCLRSHETSFDAYRTEFEDIVNSTTILLSMNDRSAAVIAETAPFTFDHGIVSAIFLVSIKCRYRDVRDRAIKIMQELPSRDGLWDTRLHASVARRMAEIEDISTEAAAETSGMEFTVPPEHCRVFNASIREETGKVEISMRPHGHDQAVLTWSEDLDGLL